MSKEPGVSQADASSSIVVACPTCRASVTWSSAARWRPFCSERCRLIDLGEWFNEEHRISDPGDTQPDS
ncbi:MAG: DNA gyrase inhibitor YacG [Gammaproteobacteria bacterium]|nr:DNA gyrase inhibitor YacG [Gammaproteobacteria bacterium]NNF62149.1 DNA gyrase inhibitor YacG [Gammaproteobacteria bacterium]NNM21840.1 DNA gyrase inhibitor YacG [Gammaproteobacteria bacterium]